MTNIPQKDNPYFETLNRDLKELIQLSSRVYNSVSECLEVYVQFCSEKTDFENIMVSEIEGDEYKILHAISIDNVLKKGMVIPLKNTICKEAFNTECTLVSPKLSESELYELPAQKFLNIEAIICTPIRIKGVVIGTLTLCSTTQKSGSAEIDYSVNLCELVGINISNVLTGIKNKEELNKYNEKLIHFNSDLNDLITINATHFDSVEDALLAYIELGKQISGFENGFVSQIEEQSYRILQSSTINNKLKKGDVFKLNDTLCYEVVELRKTIVHLTLKDKPQYSLPDRLLLKTEAVICTPIFIDDKIIGTLTFCSIHKKDNSNELNYSLSIVEIIALRIGKLIKEYRVSQKLTEERQLLDMGADFLKMASYKRYLYTEYIECTDSFFDLFGTEKADGTIHNKSVVQKAMANVLKEDYPVIMEAFRKSKVQDVLPFTYRVKHSNGDIKWLRHMLRSLPEKGYVLGVVQDITELQNAIVKYKEQNNELQQYAYATAHDLQEPLRTIEGYVNIIGEKYADKLDEDGKEFFKFIHNSTLRMKAQITGLLTHAVIGRGKERTTIDLNKMLSHIIADLSNRIEDKKAIVQVGLLPTILANKTEIRMLFFNLVNNALKFISEERKPIVEITSTDDADYWYFSIKDNGIGIAKNKIPLIFNMFTRLNERSAYEGTGLGLTHVKKIVTLHEGSLKVNSTVGEGSDFLFSLKK